MAQHAQCEIARCFCGRVTAVTVPLRKSVSNHIILSFRE
jgi:hypothetical protein